LNFEQAAVRDFFAENPEYWMREFHIDGFRLDATHAIEDDSERHILAEIAERVQSRGGFVIAEDERNDPKLLQSRARDGFGFDGCWADDFHHVLRVMMTGERESYFQNYQGTAEELADTIRNGWFFRGQTQPFSGKPRGGDPAEATSEQFVYCISNHDQTGNHAFGRRLGHLIAADAYRAASALLCLVPQTPMLFMGQEWGASTPFQFFTDHAPYLGSMITAGRRREFRDFAAFRDPALLETIPDPQHEQTFQRSKLRWDEIEQTPHANMLALHREFLALRRTHPTLRERGRGDWSVLTMAEKAVAILFGRPDHYTLAIVTDLSGENLPAKLQQLLVSPGRDRQWHQLLSSNETRFGGEDTESFRGPVTFVLEAR
jgi:maltooligosyltrehalose trehalohydrolase